MREAKGQQKMWSGNGDHNSKNDRRLFKELKQEMPPKNNVKQKKKIIYIFLKLRNYKFLQYFKKWF